MIQGAGDESRGRLKVEIDIIFMDMEHGQEMNADRDGGINDIIPRYIRRRRRQGLR